MTKTSKEQPDSITTGDNGGLVADAEASKSEKFEKKQKRPPPGLVIQPKPKLSKADRRALQEQQRAAKTSKQQNPGGRNNPPNIKQDQRNPTQPTKAPQQQKAAKHLKVSIVDSERSQTIIIQDNSLSLFSHLPQHRDMPNPYAPEWTSTLHPEVIDLGLKYATGEVCGDNERCRSMMHCFLHVLKDYIIPPETQGVTANFDFRTHFDHQVLKLSFQFWTTQCRPHSVSMGNSFTFLKTAVASLERDLPLIEAKEILEETIKRYLLERLEYADRAIAQHAMSKLQNGDVVLTFGHSEVVEVLLTTAHQAGLDFYVWVADSRPLAEGKKLLKTLQNEGIHCGYIELHALTYILQQVTKVFVGASALMSNGSIYARIGTAAVALLAKDRHIPVLVCCESYKISNKVQLESITHNELGNPVVLLPASSKCQNTMPKFKFLNLMYDVTPAEFVSGIVTELGIIPPTSVAVLLSEMNPQDAAYT